MKPNLTLPVLAIALSLAACGGKGAPGNTAADNGAEETVLNDEGLGATDNLTAVDALPANDSLAGNALDAPLNTDAGATSATDNAL